MEYQELLNNHMRPCVRGRLGSTKSIAGKETSGYAVTHSLSVQNARIGPE